MIKGYSDHAANERTFLAWVRTGIAVIAFGLVIEKFNLFMMTIAIAAGAQAEKTPIPHLVGSFGRYDGFALIVSGTAILVLSTVRFVRTTRRLDDLELDQAPRVRAGGLAWDAVRCRGGLFRRSAVGQRVWREACSERESVPGTDHHVRLRHAHR